MQVTKCLFQSKGNDIDIASPTKIKSNVFFNECKEIFGKRYANIVMASQANYVQNNSSKPENQGTSLQSLNKINKLKKNEINYLTIGSFVR